MKKCLIICLLFIFYCAFVNAQQIVKKIELKIAPFRYDYARFDPFEDLDSADLTVIINESALLHTSNDKFYKILKSSSNKEKLKEATVTDYRVKCIIYLFSGKSEVLYMNKLGEFLYESKVYKEALIKNFIFEHIPNAYKD